MTANVETKGSAYHALENDYAIQMIKLDAAEAEVERLRAALTLIASFGGKTLIAPSFGPDYDRGHQAGAHAAFESAADIARAALAKPLTEDKGANG